MIKFGAVAANSPMMSLLTLVSHELRTPLTAIMGYADIIGNDGVDDPKELKRCLDVIQKNAQCQAQVINDLMDASTILMNHLNLAMNTLDLLTAVQTVVERQRGAAEQKNISFQLRWSDESLKILADPTRLEQMIESLISNAIKFSQAGGQIFVHVRGEGSLAIFEVIDEGIGLVQSDLQKIFEPFVQADSSLTRKYGGLGLGLSITRYLAEAHGGKVFAESLGLGRGAKFTLQMSRCESAAEMPQ